MTLEQMTAEKAYELALRIQAEDEGEATRIVMQVMFESYEAGLSKGGEIAERILLDQFKSPI